MKILKLKCRSIVSKDLAYMLYCVHTWSQTNVFDRYILFLPNVKEHEFEFLIQNKNITIYNGFHHEVINNILCQKPKSRTFLGIYGYVKDPDLTRLTMLPRTKNCNIWRVVHPSDVMEPRDRETSLFI